MCSAVVAGAGFSHAQNANGLSENQFILRGSGNGERLPVVNGDANQNDEAPNGALGGQQDSGGQFSNENTGNVGEPEQEALANNRAGAPRTNVRAGVVEAGVRPVIEEDPFAPVGIPIGSLRLTSFFKQSGGYSSNKQSAPSGEGGAFSTSEFNFELRSQWGRHELTINGNGQYEDFFDRYVEPSPTINIDGSLRLDLVDGFSATLGGNYGFSKEAATSTSLSTNAVNQPGVHNFGIFGQIQRSERRVQLTLRGSIDRSVYEDAKLAGGGMESQNDRNVSNYTLRARIGYDAGLAFSPFVQASITNSVFDLKVDRNGEQRDSLAYDLRGGIVINVSEKLSGEISAGYVVQEFSDPGLAALAGFVIEGALAWSPQRDTQFELTLGSNLGGSTTAGDSGAISYTGNLGVTRRVRDNLELNASAGLTYTNFEGLDRIDTTLNANLGFEYWLNRNWSITGDASYEKLHSSTMANNYDTGIVMFGVKVQR